MMIVCGFLGSCGGGFLGGRGGEEAEQSLLSLPPSKEWCKFSQ